MRIVSVNVGRPRTVTWRGRPVTTAISCVNVERWGSYAAWTRTNRCRRLTRAYMNFQNLGHHVSLAVE